MQVRTGTAPEHMDGDSEDSERQAIRDLMDPVALEARLVIARARRAEVLAARAEGAPTKRDARRTFGSSAEALLEASIPPAGVRAAGPELDNDLLSLPLAARVRPVAAPAEPDADAAPITVPLAAHRSMALFHNPARRMPVHPEPAPDAIQTFATTHDAPYDGRSRKRRSALLVAAVLLTGAALGAASTVMLQFQGWQIAILPPATEDGPAQATTPEALPAPVETTAADPSVAPPSEEPDALASGSTGAEASVAPPLVGQDSRIAFPSIAAVEDLSPATVDPPAAGQPVRTGALPSLTPANPPETPDAQLAGLLQPAPAPLVMKSLQALSFNMGAPAAPPMPRAAEPVPPLVTASTTDMASLPPMPQSDAAPSPPPLAEPAEPTPTERAAPTAVELEPVEPTPAEPAEPTPAIASPAARIAVHFPALSPAGADKVSAELTDAGFAEVTAYPASIRISSMHVRYYHDGDRAAAERVAASTSTALDGAEVAVRSFTDLRPRPEGGLVEVWLEGDAPASQVAATPPERPVAARSAAPRASAAAPRVTQREVERQRLVGTVEQLLRERLR